MQLPSDLLVARVAFVTPNPVALTQTTILAAPGAGLRYRLWRGQVWGHRLNTAGALLDFDWQQPGNFWFGHLPLTGIGAMAPAEWPGGFAMATNQLLRIQHIATAVSQEVRVNIAYTIEAVS